jgi:transcriptional regulator with XRE-family HTH domain
MSSVRVSNFKTPAERFNYILDYMQLSDKDAAVKTKININRIKKIKDGREQLNVDDVEALVNAVPEVSVVWIFSGEGDPFTSQPNVDALSNYRDICDRFRDVRVQKRYTQEEFAKVLGIARTTVSAIERGGQAPTYAHLRILSQRFGVGYRWLIDGREDSVDSRKVKELEEKLQDCEASLRAYKEVIGGTSPVRQG